MLLFLLGLYSPECECPTETSFQTKRALTEEEGSFSDTNVGIVRNTASVCEKEIMCVALRESVYVCEEEIASVCEGLFSTKTGVAVYMCMHVCSTDIYLKRENSTSVLYFCCISCHISTQGVCIKRDCVQFLFPLLLVKMEAEQLPFTTAICTDTVHVSDSHSCIHKQIFRHHEKDVWFHMKCLDITCNHKMTWMEYAECAEKVL